MKENIVSDLSAPRVSPLRIALVYLGFLLLGLVGVMLLLAIVAALFPQNSQSKAMGVVVIMVAGMLTGQYWFNREKARPASARLWGAALVCAIVTLLVQAALFVGVMQLGIFSGAIPSGGISARDQQAVAILFAVVFVLEFLVLRLALWLGARNAAKAAVVKAERQARKAS